MRVRWMVVALLVLVSCTATKAIAQEKGQVGLAMGYPTTIGLIWHAGRNVALRPDFSFSRGSAESVSSISSSTSTSTGTGVGFGLSGLFYFREWDTVQAYFSPRYAYSRSSTTSRSDTASNTSTTSSHSAIASIGVQYSVNRRFGVFGEAGFGYTRQTASGTNFLFENTASSWATRSAVGAILYF